MTGKTAKDLDGNVVRAGDTIAFSYGIPPRRVEGTVIERHGKLMLPTPGHNPEESTLGQIKYHCGGFWLVGKKASDLPLGQGLEPSSKGESDV